MAQRAPYEGRNRVACLQLPVALIDLFFVMLLSGDVACEQDRCCVTFILGGSSAHSDRQAMTAFGQQHSLVGLAWCEIYPLPTVPGQHGPQFFSR